MKKLLCVVLAIMMLVPFGTAALAMNAGAVDTVKAEPSSNTACAEYSVESATGATISGKVNVPFTFNNDGRAILKQGGNPVKIVNIAADGTYLFEMLGEGTYDVVISIPVGQTTPSPVSTFPKMKMLRLVKMLCMPVMWTRAV